MKKVFNVLLVLALAIIVITGCSKKEENLDMSVGEVVDKLYEGIPEEDLPMLMSVDLDNDNLSYYLGVSELDFIEGVASEPMMTSIAHSVVVVKVKDDVDIEQTKKDIKEKVDPRKWLCVDAENVIVKSKGNIIVLIMTDETSTITDKLEENFDKLS